MEEIQCPMCGNPNPGEAETCQHCGARLIPLEAGASGTESSDWLESVRRDTEDESTSTSGDSSEDFPPEDPDTLRGQPSAADQGEADFDALRRETAADFGALGGESEGAEGDAEFDELRAGLDADVEQPAGEGETPEWLRRIREKQVAEPEGGVEPAPEESLRAQEFETSGAPEPEAESSGDASTDDGEILEGERIEPEETPSWLEEVEGEPTEADEALPHVPALVGGQPEPAEEEGADLDLSDWLGEIEPLEDEPAAERAPDTPDLAPATLPSWLEAMRPVETFRSVVEADSDEEQAVESAGPLAGLSGVLLAEPVVAMPRTSSIGSMQLEVSERQYAQAELLHRLVDEEESERPAIRRRGPRLAIFRWAIAAFMLIAVSLPAITGAPSFALPSLEPQELGALFDLVEGLPVEAPTLIVFDYEAGYAGELEAVSGALLDQVMARGLLVASVSTITSGSPIAYRAIEAYGAKHGYENGQDHVHLGYLSGGATGVQLFVVNPREALLEGFALPAEMQEQGLTAWESPVLEQVRSLSDFGMVAVITSGAETARVWVEQAGPRMQDTPLVVVLTAGAEPLIRPYFESPESKVSGILSGLPAATTYELRNGRLGLAHERWNPFGSGMLAAEIVLLAGIGYGIFNWWQRRGTGAVRGNV